MLAGDASRLLWVRRSTTHAKKGHTRMRVEALTPRWGTVLLSESETLGSLDRDAVAHSYRETGVVLFRGFDCDPAAFRTHTERFCNAFIVHPHPNREIISADATTMGVSPGKDHFFAHSELGYSPIRPDVAWFYCQTPARVGGETTLYDGVEVLERLSAKTRELFVRKRLAFKHQIPAAIWEQFYGLGDRDLVLARVRAVDGFTFTLDAEGTMNATYHVPAIVRTKHAAREAFANSLLDQSVLTLEDGSRVPQAMKLEILGVTEALAFPIAWRPGDIVMVDNSRFMHGRTPFDDPQRRLLARFGDSTFV
jgi:alpha-ketoglutarate-dependent taurine dioxygenase